MSLWGNYVSIVARYLSQPLTEYFRNITRVKMGETPGQKTPSRVFFTWLGKTSLALQRRIESKTYKESIFRNKHSDEVDNHMLIEKGIKVCFDSLLFGFLFASGFYLLYTGYKREISANAKFNEETAKIIEKLKLTNEKLDKISYLQGSSGIVSAVQRFEIVAEDFQNTKLLVKEALANRKQEGVKRKEMLAKLIELKWRLIDIENTLNGNEYYLNYTMTKEEYQELVMLDKHKQLPGSTITQAVSEQPTKARSQLEQMEAHEAAPQFRTESAQHMSNAMQIIEAVSGSSVAPIYAENSQIIEPGVDEASMRLLEGLMESENSPKDTNPEFD